MKECRNCGSHNLSIGITNTSSGSTVFPIYCCDCGKVYMADCVKKKYAHDYAINNGTLKYIQTVQIKEEEQEKCEVCGTLGVEYHHWAPTHLFGDEADKWPCSYLCRACHKKWHDIVTPNMSQRKNNE